MPAAMTFPAAHRVKLHPANSLECPDGEVKRRAGIAGIFPNERSIFGPAGTILLQQNDEWPDERTPTRPAIARTASAVVCPMRRFFQLPFNTAATLDAETFASVAIS